MRTIDVDTSGRVWIYTPESHKTEHHGRERRIYLGPKAQETLRPWLRPELTAYLFSPAEAEAERRAEQRENRKTRVQPSQRNRRRRKPRKAPGERYTVDSYRRAIEYGIKASEPRAGERREPSDTALASAPTPPRCGDSAPSGVRPGRGPGRLGSFLSGRDGGLRRAGRSQSGGGDGAGWLIHKRSRPRVASRSRFSNRADMSKRQSSMPDREEPDVDLEPIRKVYDAASEVLKLGGRWLSTEPKQRAGIQEYGCDNADWMYATFVDTFNNKLFAFRAAHLSNCENLNALISNNRSLSDALRYLEYVCSKIFTDVNTPPGELRRLQRWR